MEYWTWWMGGIGFASIGILFAGKRFGISGSLERSLFARETIDVESSKTFFSNQECMASVLSGKELDPKLKEDTHKMGVFSWLSCLSLIIGGFLGGILDASLFSHFELKMTLGEVHNQLFGSGILFWLTLFFGGLFIGWGTRLAGGCTSGHGLSGFANLERFSILSTVIFFGTAIIVTQLLIYFLMNNRGLQ